LQERLQQKVESEEEAVSDDLGQIAREVASKVIKNEVDISTFSPIFQELIRIQSGKAKGIKYHPM
jgi:flagellar biosynthesis/type III secretory pathway protein FliH